MNVALDTNRLYVTQAGVARYLRGLIGGLRKLTSPNFDFFELAWPVTNFSYRQPWRAMKTVYREWVWPSRVAAPRLRQEQPDLLHLTSTLDIEPPPGVPRVMTLYDLAVLRTPQRFRAWHRMARTRRATLARAMDRLICISRFTAQEAMDLLDLPASRLDVIYCGTEFHPDATTPTTPPDTPIPPEFFLFVGSLEPGKNLALLEWTYRLARANGDKLPPLVIVGARWQGVASEKRPDNNWLYLGRQSDPVLAHLYRSALALVFPSQYEGFGLPVLEAMSLGCPVICSPVASLPEVGGKAPCYVEGDPDAYRKTMLELAAYSSQRNDMIAAGKEQARRFSWNRCAAETLSVYKSMCGKDAVS